ncbi:hypothetical protein ACFLS7_06410 [Bacteroidota bacterium]
METYKETEKFLSEIRDIMDKLFDKYSSVESLLKLLNSEDKQGAFPQQEVKSMLSDYKDTIDDYYLNLVSYVSLNHDIHVERYKKLKDLLLELKERTDNVDADLHSESDDNQEDHTGKKNEIMGKLHGYKEEVKKHSEVATEYLKINDLYYNFAKALNKGIED